jgi:hypothetical protein
MMLKKTFKKHKIKKTYFHTLPWEWTKTNSNLKLSKALRMGYKQIPIWNCQKALRMG